MTATERAMCTEAEDRIRELEEELRIAAGINARMIDERDTARTDHLQALQAIRDLLHRDKTGVPLPFTRPAREYIDDAIDRLLRLPPASDELQAPEGTDA